MDLKPWQVALMWCLVLLFIVSFWVFFGWGGFLLVQFISHHIPQTALIVVILFGIIYLAADFLLRRR